MPDLSFAIKAINEASKTLRDIQGDIDSVGKTSERSSGLMGKFGGALGGVASIASGFVVGQGLMKLPGLLVGAAQAAADDEAATLRMGLALENLANATNVSMEEFGRWEQGVADAIEKGQKLAFTDDDIRDSMQALLAATGDYDEAAKRQAAAMDLARGANIPLAAATKLLGKLNEENVEVFKRMGIVIGENATEADALFAVQAKFGGQAETFGASTAGQWEQAKIRLGELTETVGGAVLPAFTRIIEVLLTHVLPAIEKIAGAIVPAFAAFYGAEFQLLLSALRFLAAFFAEHIQPRVDEFGAFVRAAFARFPGYYEENIKPALDNVKAAFGAVVAFVAEHWPQIMAVIGPVIDQVVTVIRLAFGIVRELVEIVIDLIGGDFSGAWSNLQQLVGIVWEGIVGTVRNSIGLILGLAPLIFSAGKALGQFLFDGLRSALGAVQGLALDIGQAIGEAIKRFINTFVIDRVNRALEFRFGVDIAGMFFGVDVNAPDIPHLAQGGIITRPTLALIGESGPEAVVPLGRGGGGVGNVYHITVNALDARSAADAVLEALVNLEHSGRVSPGLTAA